MAVRAVEPGVTPLPLDADIEVLGRLVVSRVAEIVELRERLADSEAAVIELTAEADAWRTKALDEAARRKADADTARRYERELVSVVHRKMVEIDALNAELEWRRLRWWRRRRARVSATATPSAPPSPAPR